MSKLFRPICNLDVIPFYLYANGEYFYWSSSGEWLSSVKSNYWHKKHLKLVATNVKLKGRFR